MDITRSSTPLSKNKFVQLALERTLRLARERISHSALAAALSRGLDIRIVGDNDFYSQRAQVRRPIRADACLRGSYDALIRLSLSMYFPYGLTPQFMHR